MGVIVSKELSAASIRFKVFLFSGILLAVFIVGGIGTFFLFMRDIIQNNVQQNLISTAEVERIKLEASVNGEIAIAMKMADSPLIKQHFLDPHNAQIGKLAADEIAGYRRAFVSNSVFWVSDADKRFFSDDAYVYTIDTADKDNYWYLMTLNETEKYNFNINYNPKLNKVNLWINAPVFMDKKPIGILGTGIDLSAFIDNIYKNYKGSADLYLFNSSGEITGARDSKLLVDKVTIDKELGNGKETVKEEAAKLKPNETVFFTSGIGEVVIGTIPVLNWYIIIIHHITIADYLESSMTILFLSMLLVMTIIVIIFNLVVNRFIRPLKKMVSVLNRISADWDLSHRIAVKSKDEIGTLGTFFNSTFETIGVLIKDIKDRSLALYKTGEELTSNMDETENTINEINAAIKQMKDSVLSQSNEVDASSRSIESIIAGLETLNEHIEVQSESVSRSSSAIEEVFANIQSVTETLIKNDANMNSLSEAAKTGRVDLEKVTHDIQNIAKESEGLLQINAVMQSIASQTNLLSMNAAIEAAHAGEAGKGFAVVADEIRKLSENSAKQSKSISDVLKTIKSSIDIITESTATLLQRFTVIEKDVGIVSNQELQIRNAMKEQEIGGRDILEAITQLNSITSQVKTSSSEMTNEGKKVAAETGKLKKLYGEVGSGMDKMSKSVEKINNSVFGVKEISKVNKKNIEILSEKLSKFKV